jgi:NAD(P)H-nitrite reductase large subunit
MKYVIIGAGIAGISAATAIKDNDANAHITILTNEFHPMGLYARKDLVRRLAQGRYSEEDVLIMSENELKSHGFIVRYEPECEVFPARQQVLIGHSLRLSYDKLLLATGSIPKVIEAPGTHFLGVHQVRIYEDISLMESWLLNIQHLPIVIVGADFLGLELAYALRKRGFEVILVAQTNQASEGIFSQTIAHVIEQRLIADGVEIIKETSVAEYHSADMQMLSAVTLTNGRTIETGLVICSVGVVPNTELVGEAGIDLDESSEAIMVSDTLQTNIPTVYAAGGCASIDGYIAAHWDESEEQGHVAGLNMAGVHTIYSPVYRGNLDTVIYDIPFGYFFTQNKEDAMIVSWGEEQEVGVAYLKDGVVIGAELINSLSAMDTLLELAKTQRVVSEEELISLVNSQTLNA